MSGFPTGYRQGGRTARQRPSRGQRDAQGRRRHRQDRASSAAHSMIQYTPQIQSLMGATQVSGTAAQQPQLRPARHARARRHRAICPTKSGIGLTSVGEHLDRRAIAATASTGWSTALRNVDVGSQHHAARDPDARVDRRVQDHHQRLRRPSGRAAAAASSTSSPSRAVNQFCGQRLRVLPRRCAERELALIRQPEHRSGDREQRRRTSTTTTSATPSAARSSEGQRCSSSGRRSGASISRAPAPSHVDHDQSAVAHRPDEPQLRGARGSRSRMRWPC